MLCITSWNQRAIASLFKRTFKCLKAWTTFSVSLTLPLPVGSRGPQIHFLAIHHTKVHPKCFHLSDNRLPPKTTSWTATTKTLFSYRSVDMLQGSIAIDTLCKYLCIQTPKWQNDNIFVGHLPLPEHCCTSVNDSVYSKYGKRTTCTSL